jgi:hypothetical protein
MAGHSNDCVDDVQLAVVIAVSSLAKVPARRIADAGRLGGVVLGGLSSKVICIDETIQWGKSLADQTDLMLEPGTEVKCHDQLGPCLLDHALQLDHAQHINGLKTQFQLELLIFLLKDQQQHQAQSNLQEASQHPIGLGLVLLKSLSSLGNVGHLAKGTKVGTEGSVAWVIDVALSDQAGSRHRDATPHTNVTVRVHRVTFIMTIVGFLILNLGIFIIVVLADIVEAGHFC